MMTRNGKKKNGKQNSGKRPVNNDEKQEAKK